MEKKRLFRRLSKKPQVQPYDRWGGCPACGGHDGYLNIGREHWFVCDRHKVKWHSGSNLFSTWKQESVALWKSNVERMADYCEVTPVFSEEERQSKMH